ncbi:heterokaryon incompatibility protein-domain-containing protein [Lasiosphaeria hispida]|uniref:Heterokaryon incompatibility protein-domain-containing protein n=1 Tax=Lasiosphaeria hispida TaxID=260671 RepID=A0AAJ0MFF6_9PEZI|nr:heterokaryon incompatibility protein-domain-containing protein [Lasiosphaeria hispida]
MRLLKTDTLELVEFIGRVKPYTILSHTWGDDEVTYQDLISSRAAAKKKAGYAKIAGCCARAVDDGYEYIWVDTCCIDKTSSAELSEAINSMYRWYQEAHICYAYMSDVSLDVRPAKPASEQPSMRPAFRTIPSLLREYDTLPRTFEHSRWFTRGWTLQELIAPPMVEFYDQDWREIGTKFSLRKVISKVTGIDIGVLEGADPATCHVAERMSWAANRQTTRVEDAAYCLLGIFKVHMPLIYGEGSRAFFRLQEEIMKTTEDYTMLAWGLSKYLSSKHYWKGVPGTSTSDPRRPLADSPNDFELHSRAKWTYSHLLPEMYSPPTKATDPDDTPPLMTSRGLRVTLLLRAAAASGDIHAYINATTTNPSSPASPPSPVCLILRPHSTPNIYTGSDDPNNAFILLPSPADLTHFTRKTIYLSAATVDSPLHNHRATSLEKNLYMLERPRTARLGEVVARPWKVTSCFSHAIGAGKGHAHFEVPRRFVPGGLYTPFDVPPDTARVFAFERGAEGFGVVVGSGWVDVVDLRSLEFKARWGTLVREGNWDEVAALKFLCYVSQDLGEEVDRVERRVGGVTVVVGLKKVRKGDVNCESAIKIVWSVA